MAIWGPEDAFSERWRLFGGPPTDAWAQRSPWTTSETNERLLELLGDPVWAADYAPWPVVRFGLPYGWHPQGAAERYDAAMAARRREANRRAGAGWDAGAGDAAPA